jgi:hypothetical protein
MQGDNAHEPGRKIYPGKCRTCVGILEAVKEVGFACTWAKLGKIKCFLAQSQADRGSQARSGD